MFYYIIFFFTSKMESLSPLKHRKNIINSNASEQGRAPPELARRRSSFLDVPGKHQQQLEWTAWGTGNNERKPTKLLLNVNLQNSLGPVQVVMSPENSVRDLIKAVVEIYVRGKRRPLLASSDPRNFKLHYSQFSLEGEF